LSYALDLYEFERQRLICFRGLAAGHFYLHVEQNKKIQLLTKRYATWLSRDVRVH
jgi:hypothetical protein